MRLRLVLQPQRVAVCRLAPDAAIPAWARGAFVSITRTHAELSIICDAENVADDVVADRGWRLFELVGPFAFEVTGVAASLSNALASNGISLLLIATYDTDYLLVKEELLERATNALRQAGHDVS
ncbi:MAG TPA: ACT domain-containing protein [Thermoanaerobaculia bacterium]|nr:ACT domain-containing protein [Thermoanaerobaculia bacterium]